MDSDKFKRLQRWHSQLVRLHPKAFRDRFGDGMRQTFNDLCRERAKEGKGMAGFAFWSFAEMAAAIAREHAAEFAKGVLRCRGTLPFKLAILVAAGAALAFCMVALPNAVGHEVAGHPPEKALLPILFLVCAQILAIPFLIGLRQAFALLTLMDTSNLASKSSVEALGRLKCAASAISLAMVAGIVALMILSRGKGEDITGIVAPAALVTIVSGGVATAAALFQRKVRKAIR